MAADDRFSDVEEEEEESLEVPGFQGGGKVERSGIAFVHEGEYIVPASGSSAVVVPSAGGDAHRTVSLYFPVEIQVIGELTDSHKQAVAEYVFEQLDTALRSRA